MEVDPVYEPLKGSDLEAGCFQSGLVLTYSAGSGQWSGDRYSRYIRKVFHTANDRR